MITPPDFVRPAEQHERDVAGAVERRIESSLHRYWLALAQARTRDWWNRLVPAEMQAAATRRRRGAGVLPPAMAVRRLAVETFLHLFRSTFKEELEAVFGIGERRHEYVTEVLISARDAAAHPGRPYLAADARAAAALAWDVIQRIPVEHHDPQGQLDWLSSQPIAEGEGFDAEDWDCTGGPISPDLWADLHRLVSSFKPMRVGGDGGFSEAVEGLIGRYGLNLFMRAGELTLGTGLPAASGLFHEHDLGVVDGPHLVVLELKHRTRGGVTKDDVLIFNQKTLDFQLALIRAGTRGRLLRAFVTNDRTIRDGLRGFCLQWGILLIDPSLLPIPALVAALRDLEGTAVAIKSPRFESALIAADRLGATVRPLDRVLVPSGLSPWRRLLDAGDFPTGSELTDLLAAHRDVDAYARSLVEPAS